MNLRRVSRWAGLSVDRSPLKTTFEAIDAIDDLVQAAKPVPFTSQVRINGDAVRYLLDQIRASIPEEISIARQIESEDPEVYQRAKERREQRIAEAQAKRAATSELEDQATSMGLGDET